MWISSEVIVRMLYLIRKLWIRKDFLLNRIGWFKGGKTLYLTYLSYHFIIYHDIIYTFSLELSLISWKINVFILFMMFNYNAYVNTQRCHFHRLICHCLKVQDLRLFWYVHFEELNVILMYALLTLVTYNFSLFLLHSKQSWNFNHFYLVCCTENSMLLCSP